MHLLENIQDEVHRFAITFHRDKRSKSQIASALDGIKGIGEKRKTALLKEFKSVARIKQATVEELAAVIGEAAAKKRKKRPLSKKALRNDIPSPFRRAIININITHFTVGRILLPQRYN